ncbi:MAG: hypothetical protein HOH43_13665 [Candidatus Latescibacteria bacterium]|jgi:uncharacterized protein YdhG (YjbR/CyaY superfamily)|nr:hypothetical protein [Candidatus Latescibacterota bacterium]
MSQKKITDDEFEKMLQELDEVGREADRLRKRVHELIGEVQEALPEEEDSEEPDEV